jgi:leucyl/phenylalanyl-tRNA--protein transferase
MFSAEPNASKIALASLVDHARAWEFTVIDCQLPSRHLQTLGAREIPRVDFLKLVAEGLRSPTRRGRWHVETE